MKETTWQLDPLNSAKPSSCTPLRKPALPFADVTNIPTSVPMMWRREVHNLIIFTMPCVIIIIVQLTEIHALQGWLELQFWKLNRKLDEVAELIREERRIPSRDWVHYTNTIVELVLIGLLRSSSMILIQIVKTHQILKTCRIAIKNPLVCNYRIAGNLAGIKFGGLAPTSISTIFDWRTAAAGNVACNVTIFILADFNLAVGL